jgi:glyoxylase-like metal-dependent hydrolase (beta-lactamase superfamily II)
MSTPEARDSQPGAAVGREPDEHAGADGDARLEGDDARREDGDEELLRGYDILRVRAPNPGPLTLSGTNSWLVGRGPTWLIDPGPAMAPHLARLEAAIAARGGLGGIALTHDHRDHSEGVAALRARHAVPLAAARGPAEIALAEGVRFGPLEAVPTPGHAPDHFAFVGGGACFTGDAVLGEGSVFISPYRGAMAGYLIALTRLRMREDFDVLCPGHGPPVWDAHLKLEEYVNHRIDREQHLLAALGEGRRSVQELLDAVWSDVPEQLRPMATVTLAAHLDKLEEEQTLPPGVERPRLDRGDW